MTYRLVVAAGSQKVFVKVEAHSEQAAQAVARWLVEHSKHLQVHATEKLKAKGSVA